MMRGLAMFAAAHDQAMADIEPRAASGAAGEGAPLEAASLWPAVTRQLVPRTCWRNGSSTGTASMVHVTALQPLASSDVSSQTGTDTSCVAAITPAVHTSSRDAAKSPSPSPGGCQVAGGTAASRAHRDQRRCLPDLAKICTHHHAVFGTAGPHHVLLDAGPRAALLQPKRMNNWPALAPRFLLGAAYTPALCST